jgi:hypothetical protein
MSTPSGKPGNPIDLSAYEPRRARERVAATPHPSEGKTDPLRSPYAPKRVQPAGTERQPVENGRDPLRSPYAPMKSRRQPAVAPELGIIADAEPPPPMRVRKGSRERPTAERHTLGRADHSPKTALEEGTIRRHPVTAASFQPVHPSRGRYQPAPERGDEIMSDHDLKQLEASLRWLQRQEAAARLTRAAPLIPVPGLASAHTTGRHHNSEMPVDSLQAPRSLEPERLAPPFAMSSRKAHGTGPNNLKCWLRLRCPPSARAYPRRRDHLRARRGRCCRGAPTLRLHPLSSAPLIPRKSSFSQDKASNSLRQAIWSRRGSYCKELLKPAMPPLRPRWERRMIPMCWQS